MNSSMAQFLNAHLEKYPDSIAVVNTLFAINDLGYLNDKFRAILVSSVNKVLKQSALIDHQRAEVILAPKVKTPVEPGTEPEPTPDVPKPVTDLTPRIPVGRPKGSGKRQLRVQCDRCHWMCSKGHLDTHQKGIWCINKAKEIAVKNGVPALD